VPADPGGRLLLAAWIAFVPYLVAVMTSVSHPEARLGLNLAFAAFLPVPLILCLCAARDARRTSRSRSAWSLMTLSLGLGAVGAVVEMTSAPSLPGPPLAVPWLLAIPMVVAAILRFEAPRRTREGAIKTALDFAVVMLTGFIVIWTIEIAPFLPVGPITGPSAVTGILYTLGDLTLMLGIAVARIRGTSPEDSRALRFIAWALVCVLVGDLVRGTAIAIGSASVAGAPILDLFMVMGMLALGAAARTTPDREDLDPARAGQKRGVDLAPYLAMVFGFAVTGTFSVLKPGLDPVLLATTLAQFGVVVMRLAVAERIAIREATAAAAANARAEAAAAIAESEDQLRSALATTRAVLFHLDDEGHFEWIANAPAWVDPVGAVTQSVWDIEGPREGLLFEVVKRVLATGEAEQIEFPISRPNGPTGTWNVTIRPRRAADGSPMPGLVGHALDVTDDRRAAADLYEAQKLESLGVLAGGVAHDFNNLLVPVVGNVDLVLKEIPADSPIRGALLDIAEAGRRATELVRQLLVYTGRSRARVEALDLSALIRDLGRLLDTAVPAGATLTLDLAEDLPTFPADASQVSQLVMNLVSNAAEALGGDPGEILVRAAAAPPGSDGSGAVVLTVKDTGTGMDEATRSRIFYPFFSTKFPGRGLGLAVVAGVARTHRAEIQVVTDLGGGSTFSVTFPLGSRDEPVAVQQEAFPTLPGPAAREARTADAGVDTTTQHGDGPGTPVVLVADDDTAVRGVARLSLQRAGYRVIEAGDGQAALDALTRGNPPVDVVLLDLTMPRMGGPEAFRIISTRFPDVPVIITSGHGRAEVNASFVVPASGRPPAGQLDKPYLPGELVGLVAKVLAEPHLSR
jgi:signal transduction histidine kinase